MNVRHRSMHSLVCTSGAMAAVLLGGAVSTAFAAASLTPLGDLPGGVFYSHATGVSGDGSVVVGISNPTSNYDSGFQAFRWTSGSGIVGLSGPSGTSAESGATGISADGSVIVGGLGSLGDQAVRWTSGGMVPLGDLPGGADYSTATGVSGDGSVVVGYSSSENSPYGLEAFRWTEGSGMVGLGDLPGFDFYSDARGVSGDGSVVVGYSHSASGTTAFRWTSDGGMVGLGVGVAYGVSSDGSVIVGQSFSASGVPEAFRWTSDGGMVGLGDLSGGSFASEASGVSGDGSVVVGALDNQAFRWTSGGGMERLWDVLVANGVDPAAAGWSNLNFASGVSVDGNTIVGFGNRNNTIEAFVAVIPISSPLPGDFDGDGDVDGADFVAWQTNFPKASGATLAQGDADGDGDVDGADFVVWQTNFPFTPSPGASPIPEPAAGALALVGVSSILLLRRRSLGRPNKVLWAPGGFRARRQTMRSNVCAFLVILLCTSAAARAFAAASLTPLGDLPGGGVYSKANGVSGDGSVIVGYSSSASGSEAFRWTSDGGMVGLGDLPGGGFSSEAYGVSGDGSVIVGGSSSASGGEAFRWTSDGGMMGLGKLPGAVNSGAYGVSGDGSVVVGASDRDISREGGEEAFRWTSDGGMVGLGHLPGGIGSAANGVSAHASVIVGWSSSNSGLTTEAFRWTAESGMVSLGNPPGGINSVAHGVSADGSVIVGISVFSFDHGEASRWTSDGGAMGLGYLPGGAYRGTANGVSGDGSVVVGYNTLDTGFSVLRAFYWTADGGMRALWDLLLSHGVDPAADGWTELSSVRGISADGNTIVGYGIRNNNGEAFVAVLNVVPEPAAGALALLGVSSILLLRRRSVWRSNKFEQALTKKPASDGLTVK